MSTAYEREILNIDEDVSIDKAQIQVYTADFHIICKHVLDAMSAESPLFRQLYCGTSLFGSYLENLKIDKPDEFDVHVVLHVPCTHLHDKSRPGFVKIKLTNKKGKSKHLEKEFEAIAEVSDRLGGGIFVNRIKLQNWLKAIIDKVFGRSFNQSVRSCTGIEYKLLYSKCATAHNIKAISKDRTIKIDLVPAFKFKNAPIIRPRRKKMLQQIPNKQWFAVPKEMEGDNNTHHLSFSVCAPQMEKFLLIDKGNMKRCLRLMKSLRDKVGAYGLKSYFLKTLFLYEINEHDDEFWNQPVGTLLLHMLGVLLIYLIKENLPFFWHHRQNLLCSLQRSDIHRMEKSFSIVRHQLLNFSNSSAIPSSEIRALFDIPK